MDVLLLLQLQLVPTPKGEGGIVLHHGVGLALTLVPFGHHGTLALASSPAHSLSSL